MVDCTIGSVLLYVPRGMYRWRILWYVIPSMEFGSCIKATSPERLIATYKHTFASAYHVQPSMFVHVCVGCIVLNPNTCMHEMWADSNTHLPRAPKSLDSICNKGAGTTFTNEAKRRRSLRQYYCTVDKVHGALSLSRVARFHSLLSSSNIILFPV